MSTIEQVREAELRMNRARTVLRAYVERPAGAPVDILHHRHLAEQLKVATDEYVRLVLELQVETSS